jgi:hypothetical protein
MTESIHNLILSYNELNIIQDSLKEIGEKRTDGDSIRELHELREKIANQRDDGNFKENKLKDVLITNEQVYDYLGEDSDGDAVEILANLASGTYSVEQLQKDILNSDDV